MKKTIFAGILFMAIAANIFADVANDNKILIYGHRGARGLAPENTIPAYQVGLKIGVDYVDMDVGMTKDGVVVVTHDFALNPDLTRDSFGNWINDPQILIKDITFAKLQKYDVGALKPGTKYAANFPDQKAIPHTRIPSLQEVIRFVKKSGENKIKFQVEIKTDPVHPEWTYSPKKIATAVVKILEQEGLADCTDLQSFDWRVLQIVQKLNPKIATAYLTDHELTKQMYNNDPKIAGLWSAGFLIKNYENSLPKMIAKLGGKVWGAESVELTVENVRLAHSLGLRVVPWTINTKEEMRRMIAFKVDGIITDRPDILHEVDKGEI